MLLRREQAAEASRRRMLAARGLTCKRLLREKTPERAPDRPDREASRSEQGPSRPSRALSLPSRGWSGSHSARRRPDGAVDHPERIPGRVEHDPGVLESLAASAETNPRAPRRFGGGAERDGDDRLPEGGLPIWMATTPFEMAMTPIQMAETAIGKGALPSR